MSERFTTLVAQAICDADGPDGPSYEHLAAAAIRVIEQEFEVFRVENDRLRTIIKKDAKTISELRAELIEVRRAAAKALGGGDE